MNQGYCLFIISRVAIMLSLLGMSTNSYAVSGYLKSQSPEQLTTYVLALIGVLITLLIVPLIQFYFSALKAQRSDEEREQYYRVLDNFKTGAIYLDANNKIVYVNTTTQKVLEQSEDQLVGQEITDVFHESVAKRIENAFLNDTPSVEVLSKSSEHSIMLNVGDTVIEGDAAVKIITLNKVDEEDDSLNPNVTLELDKAGISLSRMLELSPLAIGTLNKNHEITSANKALIERLKYSEKELKKGNLYKLFGSPEESGNAAKMLDKHHKLNDFHVQLIGKDGESYPSEMTIALIDKDSEEYIFWIINRSDEQFQHDKFDSLLEGSALPVAILDEHKFGRLNQKACEFFNIEDEREFNELSPYSIELNESEEKANELKEIIDHVTSQGAIYKTFWTFAVGDKQLPCEITFAPVFKDHNLDSILCSWKDLTAINKAYESISEERELKEALEAEKVTLIGDLEDTNTALSQTKEELQTTENTLSGVNEAHSDLCEKHDEIRAFLNEVTSELNETKQTLSDVTRAKGALEEEIGSTQSKFQAIEASYQETSEQLKEANSEKDSIDHKLGVAEKRIVELSAIQKEDQTFIEQLQRDLDAANESFGVTEAALNELESQFTDLTSSNENLAQNNDSLNNYVEELKIENDSLHSKQSDLLSDVDTLRSNLSKTQDSYDEEKAELEQQLLEGKASVESLTEEVSKLTASLNDKSEELITLNDNYSSLQVSTQAKEDDVIKLSAEISTANETITGLSSSIDTLKEDIQNRNQDISHLKEEVQQAHNEGEQKLSSLEDTHSLLVSQYENEIADLRASAEGRLDELDENQANFMELQNAFRDSEKEVAKLIAKQTRGQEELKALSATIEKLVKEVAAKDEYNIELQEKIDTLNNNTSESEKLREDEHKKLIENLETEIVELRANAQGNLSELEEVQSNYFSIQDALKEKEQSIETLETQRLELDAKLVSLSNNLENAVNEGANKDEQNEALKRQLDELTSNKSEIEKSLDDVKSRSSEKQQETETLVAQLASLQQRYEQTKASLSESEASLANANEQTNQYEIEQAKQAELINDLQQKISHLAESSDKREDEFNENDQKFKQQDAEKDALIASLSSSVEQAQEQIETLKTNLEQQETAKKEAEIFIEKTQTVKSKLEEKLELTSREIDALTKDNDEKDIQRNTLSKKLAEQESTLEQKQNEYALKLEELKIERDSLSTKLASAGNSEQGSKLTDNLNMPEIAALALPGKTDIWFDLAYFWSSRSSDESLSQSLITLISDFEAQISVGEKATQAEDLSVMLKVSTQLLTLAKSINSDALVDLLNSFNSDCKQGMIDNAMIRWMPTKLGIQRSQRVIYELLNNI